MEVRALPGPPLSLSWRYVTAGANGWGAFAVFAALAADRQAKHMQMAMVLLLAAELPRRAAFATIVTAMYGLHEARREAGVEPERGQSQCHYGGE